MPLTSRQAIMTSYFLAMASVLLVLHFHLVPGALAGLMVYALTLKLAKYIPQNLNHLAKQIALSVLVVVIILAVLNLVFSIWSFLDTSQSLNTILMGIADTLVKISQSLPVPLNPLPQTLNESHLLLSNLLQENSHQLSLAGVESLKVFAQILICMVIGGVASLQESGEDQLPLASELRSRLRTLADSFDKVVFAQVKISALNTTLTAIYLLIVLPTFGVHLKMAPILVCITFITGLIPIFGNLISNSITVLVCLGISVQVALASLFFLIVIHKVEFFLNAKICAHEVKAASWEILTAMIILEAIYGMPGIIAAPTVYAWAKTEMKLHALV